MGVLAAPAGERPAPCHAQLEGKVRRISAGALAAVSASLLLLVLFLVAAVVFLSDRSQGAPEIEPRARNDLERLSEVPAGPDEQATEQQSEKRPVQAIAPEEAPKNSFPRPGSNMPTSPKTEPGKEGFEKSAPKNVMLPLLREREVEDRVRKAGGKFGKVNVSLAWQNYNDLDLHVVTETGERIFFGHRHSKCGGMLDIDQNVFPTRIAPWRTYTGRRNRRRAAQLKSM